MNITNEELNTAYKKLVKIHGTHLVGEGVKMPKQNTAKAYQLAILLHCSPNFVHKDKISDVIRQWIPYAARDQQVRHLKRDGWNLETDGGKHRITDPYRTHPNYARQQIKSQNLLLAGDFDGIKRAFSFKCATCGAKEDEPHPRYTEGIVKLQQGHMDPAKAQTTANIIPQCQFCNRAYKDDFTFDEKGRVKAVASPKPVLRASKQVRLLVADALQKKDGKNDQ